MQTIPKNLLKTVSAIAKFVDMKEKEMSKKNENKQ